MGGDKTMSGYSNHETLKVALMLANDYESYQLAKTCPSFEEFRERFGEDELDGVKLDDPRLNIKELDRQIANFFEPTDHDIMSSFGTKWHDGL